MFSQPECRISSRYEDRTEAESGAHTLFDSVGMGTFRKESSGRPNKYIQRADGHVGAVQGPVFTPDGNGFVAS